MGELLVFDPTTLEESVDLEAKLARGRNGRGELPNDFFPTYSAMANTEGGIVLLGVEQADAKLIPAGIADVSKVLKTLWDALNNRQRISKNLLNDQLVETLQWEGKTIIKVTIPRARREDRPVYVGSNPMTGTFKRNYEGDYHCDEDTIKRMLADQTETSRDSKILPDFDSSDLDQSSLKAYRNQFASTKPDHPYLLLDDGEFLRSIGANGKDRVTKVEGLTLAGLLMFGKHSAIREALPQYFIDYQERPEPKADARFIDRVTPDGTWSGNLYDFYRKVILKLYEGLKVPFVLKSDIRIEQTPVHEALREALINTLIHADFSGSVGILVVKRPDMFGFRNPGTMRVSIEDAIRGGVSDSRNRSLQQMFRYVGVGEQMGSGVPKIYSAWKEQHWRLPVLREKTDRPDYTQLELRMISLLPQEVIGELTQRFGGRFGQLSEMQRIALVTVSIEGEITHSRLKGMVADHPHDITKALAGLVREGFLASSGASRGTRYFFPDKPPEDIGIGTSEHSRDSSEHRDLSSEHKGTEAPYITETSPNWAQALAVSEPVRKTKRLPPKQVIEIIIRIGELGYFTLPTLATLLNRAADTLRVHYLTDMLENGVLETRHPTRSHPQQAYRTKPTKK